MNVQEELDRLQAELAAANAEIDRLNFVIRDKDLIIRQAKDATSVVRPNLRRVLVLAHAACLDVSKVKGGWLLSMGSSLRRRFKSLRQIWDLLVAGDWFLSDLFNEKISTPVAKKVPWAKLKSTFSLDIAPFDVNGLISLGRSDRLEFDVPFG